MRASAIFVPFAWGTPAAIRSVNAILRDLATERGIAINPRRKDLLDAVKGSSLPVRPIQEMQREIEKICGGKPQKPRLTEKPVAVVKWVDGTVLDTVWQIRT